MWFRRRPAYALTALLALVAPTVIGFSIALHLATDDHHGAAESHEDDSVDLEMALHGHAHLQGTPSHGHPLLRSAGAATPAATNLVMSAILGGAPAARLFGSPDQHLLACVRPALERPPKPPKTTAILRI